MSPILIFLFLSLAAINIDFCGGSFNDQGCLKREREALLMFKQDLVDEANQLASWTDLGEDCCGWVGVVCDNATGHVLELHLGNPQPILNDYDYTSDAGIEAFEMSKLKGKIHPSLLNLKHLSYLDLSNNAFGGIPIPEFLGFIDSLRHLNLSSAGFGGLVPHQLGNLSNLQYLNLYTDSEQNLYVASLQWLSGLSSLEHLDLGYVNLEKAWNWLQVLNTLPSLEKLYLSNCQLPQVILPPTNLNLSSLVILDLSSNYFKNPVHLSWIFHLNTLVSLDLSNNDLEVIVHGLQNMTSLRHLDLSYNSFNSSIPEWLYNLNSLRFLDLSYNNLKGEISSAIGNLTSVISIDFSGNIELERAIPRSMGNLCNLKSINYSGVNLKQDVSDIFEIFSGCVSKQLDSLFLNWCQLSGQLSNQLGNFKNLKELYLIGNSISGPIPLSIGELSSLRVLRIGRNKLIGQLPKSIGQLANLEILGIFYNLLDGVVSEIHFANLTKLKILIASRNNFSLKFSPDWTPPFQLQVLDLISLDVDSQFPMWICSQKHLLYLDISNSMISDSLPGCFWDSIFQFVYVNLSYNQMHGQIPSIPRISFTDSHIDLSFNRFSGPLPHIISSNLSFLDLSGNHLSGSLFPLLCLNLNETMGMETLNLGENLLSGEIPDCWMKWQHLNFIRLDNNDFIGRIPSSLGSLHSLQSLKLHNNYLFGEIPLSLTNCTDLVFLDFGENELYGNITKWLGQGAYSLSKLRILGLRSNKFSGHIPNHLCAFTSLQILDLTGNNLIGSLPRCIGNFTAGLLMLKILSLRSNKFSGHIPDQFCTSASLQVLDLANNNIVGSLPRCIGNFTAMARVTDASFTGYINMTYVGVAATSHLNVIFTQRSSRVPFSALLIIKGQMLEYSTNLDLVRSIDVSNNKLSGEIPMEVTSLFELQSLNLSHNLLTGKIPENIGVMKSLESLDFSMNKLSGSIPRSMSDLTFLSHLNLSCNILTGEIPSSTQLQSFDSSSYVGNQLCGLPLPQKCSDATGTTPTVGDEAEAEAEAGGENENGFDTFWFCVGIPFGFVVGFWGVVGCLLIKTLQ